MTVTTDDQPVTVEAGAKGKVARLIAACRKLADHSGKVVASLDGLGEAGQLVISELGQYAEAYLDRARQLESHIAAASTLDAETRAHLGRMRETALQAAAKFQTTADEVGAALQEGRTGAAEQVALLGNQATAAADHIDTGHRHRAEAIQTGPVEASTSIEDYQGMADYNTNAGGGAASAGHSGTPARERPLLPDPLRIADRVHLEPGEQFAGSGSVKNDEGMMVLVAAMDTPSGRQVHLGVPIHEDDKRAWRGAHAPAQITEVDDDGDDGGDGEDGEDGEEVSTDTGSDTTVILDAADAARLPEVVDDVIARATAADKEFRPLLKDFDRLHAQRAKLEATRFGGEASGEEKIILDARVQDDERYQERRRRDRDRAADSLSPADQAAYDDLQGQIDAAGRDGWEPGKEAEAAAVCGLTVDEFRETQALKRIPWQQRTANQQDRLDELERDSVLPPLLAQQAALICGLTVDEVWEMQALEAIPKPHAVAYFNRSRRTRTPAEQARLDELDASPRGATGANQRQTQRLRSRYLTMLKAHHSAKSDLARAREDQAAMDATAQPLDPGTTAELERVTADLDQVNTKFDELSGTASATAEIPGQNGGALMIEAIQREEGGVDYRMDRRPPDADEDWSPGDSGDPFTASPAGMRKAAALVRTLMATPAPK